MVIFIGLDKLTHFITTQSNINKYHALYFGPYLVILDGSLEKKYLTTSNLFVCRLQYFNTPDQHHDLKKPTCSSVYLTFESTKIDTEGTLCELS